MSLPNHEHNRGPPHKPRCRKLLNQMYTCLPTKASNVKKGADAVQNRNHIVHSLVRLYYGMKTSITFTRAGVSREKSMQK